jgi:hypothetical protein
MKKVSFILCLFALGLALPQLSEKTVKKEIENMLVPSVNNVYEIISISKPVKNFSVVALTPPYREFPNIILFEYKNGVWQRVYECLSVGIQDEPSDIIDLHTAGLAVDMVPQFQGKSIVEDGYSFLDKNFQDMLEAFEKNNFVVIFYQNFVHAHHLPNFSGKSSYIIDKRNYLTFANQLFNNRYTDKNYPRDNCMMYDLPLIKSLKFDYTNVYCLVAETDNGQVWEITFSGVEDKYLTDKKISVK